MKKTIALAMAVFMTAGASTALAETINISSTNSATITNNVSTAANTGGSVANGARASTRIFGGNVSDSNFGNEAGNGGSTVLGGLGGTIRTGDVQSVSEAHNTINENVVRVRATPWAVGAITVGATNGVTLANVLSAGASSSGNTSAGEAAESTTNGGNVEDVGSSNVAGNAGNHVEGGKGGTIETGDAVSQSMSVNVINRNVTRIRK